MCKLGFGVDKRCFRNVDSTLQKGRRTALHVAAVTGKEKCISILIQNGARLEAKDRDGATPLKLAAWKNYCNSIRILITSGATKHNLKRKQLRKVQACMKKKLRGGLGKSRGN